MGVLLLLLPLLLQAPDTSVAGIEGHGRPKVTIPRIEATATIDGKLDEPVWNQATRLTGFSQYEPVDGRPAEEKTDVLVWYAPNAIYFGIKAYDRQPSTIRASRADRDNIDSDDYVIIYLDTFNDRRRAFFFAVNPLGIQQDGVRSEGAASPGNMFGGTIDKNPDYLYESRGQVTDSGYVVEVKIPFKSLRYPGNGPQLWGHNFLRRTKRSGYNDTWTDVRRASASFLVQAGTIDGLHDLHRGLVVEAQPFVTGSSNGALNTTTGDFKRESLDTEAGVNFRLGFTNLSLDGTVNPDFSQVESDVSQVTVNQRFALFFPEKRPFFLEGIELFSTANQLVYTRQIVNPIVGAKVTGKLGDIGVAHLTAVDQVDENGDGRNDNALFNITRLRRDFGSNSMAGVTYTDRSMLEGPGYNRVLEGDVRYVFAKLYYIETQVGGSWTRDSAGFRTSPLWKAEWDRTGRSWGFNYQVNAIGQHFETRSGFVNRNNVVTAHAFNRLTWYGSRGAWLENYTVFFGPNRIWRYGDIGGNAIEGSEEINNQLRFRGGWQLRNNLTRQFVDFQPADYLGYQVMTPGGNTPFVPLAGVSGLTGSIALDSPVYQGFDASITIARGRAAIFQEAAKAIQTSIVASVDFRPTSGVRISAQNTFLRIVRSRDRSRFARTIIPRVTVEYQPARALFFRVVGEYVSQTTSDLIDGRTGDPILINGLPVIGGKENDLRADFLISLEPTPGTVAFLGYGSSMQSDETLGFNDLKRTSDGFFVKFAYQFRQ
jgi:hypothetical protein